MTCRHEKRLVDQAINKVLEELVQELGAEEISVITWERLYEVANEDSVLVKLKEVVLGGFPQSSYDVDAELKQYHKFKHDLHMAEEIVCYKDRIIIHMPHLNQQAHQ